MPAPLRYLEYDPQSELGWVLTRVIRARVSAPSTRYDDDNDSGRSNFDDDSSAD